MRLIGVNGKPGRRADASAEFWEIKMANVETDPTRSGVAGVAQALQHTAEEGLLVWNCTSAAYLDYLAALLQARSVEGLFQANAKFLSATADLANRAAGSMQSYYGVVTPTLNDT